jgi:hypothetical protein
MLRSHCCPFGAHPDGQDRMQELSFGRTAGVHAVLYAMDPHRRTAEKILKKLRAMRTDGDDGAGDDPSPRSPGAVSEVAAVSFAAAGLKVQVMDTAVTRLAKQAHVHVSMQASQFQPSLVQRCFSRLRQALGLGPSKPPALLSHNELQAAMGFNLVSSLLILLPSSHSPLLHSVKTFEGSHQAVRCWV